MPDAEAELPRLKKAGKTWELIVDGKPFLVLGAELQNSAMSSARYMDTAWQNIKDIGVNTVLGNISWEDIEPEEGKFNFTEMDAVIAGARAHGLRLILLWFGSFKNGVSCYVPSWVKKDVKRFPRMQSQTVNGCLETSNVISIFHEECVLADCTAFTAFMQHLKEVDVHKTVIMVQVENEVGFLGDSRDRSSTAEKLFRSPVPAELVEFLATSWDALLPNLKVNFPHFSRALQQSKITMPSGSWEECFGSSLYTCELFMAYHYALYVDKVAVAGRKAYDLPLFTNVWMPKPGSGGGMGNIASGGNAPGEYPSGGATPTVLDVWHKFAPTLDFISPDIYEGDYAKICACYSHNERVLFIPEQRRDEVGARRTWEAIGAFHGLGACPHILQARSKPESIMGFYFDEPNQLHPDPTPMIKRTIGAYELSISRAFVLGRPGPAFGIILELQPERYLLIGMGYKVEFKSTSPTSFFSGILRFEEKSVIDPEKGTLRTERVLNGDESRSGKWANMPPEVPDMGKGFIPLTIPARTMIAEIHVYSLDSSV
ncbi:family 35 putative beta-galactosidase glycoside hydrolase [Thozetella sp. PMI_491]|nr:family 35 putative beta-galactosidase glycoside hydrolase [Thozetella sp. PMI_491]